jgi:hypothetical protein
MSDLRHFGGCRFDVCRPSIEGCTLVVVAEHENSLLVKGQRDGGPGVEQIEQFLNLSIQMSAILSFCQMMLRQT